MFLIPLFVAILGLFTGLYASYVGTPGGSAIMTFLLLQMKIIPSVNKVTGTILLVSCLPLGWFGIYEYYKNKDIDFFYGTLIGIGLIIGLIIGSKTNFIIDGFFGEKYNEKIKLSITSCVFLLLAVLYGYKALSR